MNTVSWLVYLTYVIPSISWFAAAGAVVLLVAVVFLIIFWNVTNAEANSKYAKPEDKEFPTFIAKQFKWVIPSFLLCLFTATVTPNQQTMYMIAASELGEEVIMSNEAKVLYQDLRDILATYKAKEATK